MFGAFRIILGLAFRGIDTPRPPWEDLTPVDLRRPYLRDLPGAVSGIREKVDGGFNT